MRNYSKLLVLLASVAASSALFAQQSAPASTPTTVRPAPTAQGQAGAKAAGAAAAGQTGVEGAGLAGLGIPGAVAAGLTAVGAAATNETGTTPPKH